MKVQLPRLDGNEALREKIRPYCRLQPGDIWQDPQNGHRVGVLDAANPDHLRRIMGDETAPLLINDPPYNLTVGHQKSRSLSKINLDAYLDFSRRWLQNMIAAAAPDAHFFIWLGADYRDHFQPLPDLMILLRQFSRLSPRNLITLRNQRGYGTQHNWMWVRQELLHYTQGDPPFQVVYTDIPKILRGYYKKVGGKRTENLERSKSNTLRPGNVWVDIQQVFYRMEENVPGCYAQKPLKAIDRLLRTSSRPGDLVLDGFAHSGTTLLAGEVSGRRVFTFDNDPIFAEMTIRRLERFRTRGKTGWQWRSPFPEIDPDDTGKTV